MAVKLNFSEGLFNPAYRPYIFDTKRYNFFFGGASSGKSYFIAQRYLIRLLKDKGRNLLALRKVSNKARVSVFAIFKQLIYKWHLDQLVSINNTNMTITFMNGNIIRCYGLDDPEKIKSITADNGVFTDVWIEECSEVTYEDFQQADLRLRGFTEHAKQVTMSTNPVSHLHWTKGFFFDNPSEYIQNNTTILKTTFRDNLEHLSPEDVYALDNIKDENMRRIYRDGDWGVLGSIIYTNWNPVDKVPEHITRTFYGVDFGFTVDPAVLLKISQVGEDDFYIEELIYEKGLSNSEFVNLAKAKGVKENDLIFADSAEPKAIEEIRQYGLRNVRPAVKGRDSVKTGIDFLKTKNLHILRNSQDTINEISMYQYQKDKNGNELPVPMDYKNHSMDAMRYGIYSATVSRGRIRMVGF